MPRFFIDKKLISEGVATLTGDDAHHISRSLRMKQGEELTLCDGDGCDYLCRIDSISDKSVVCSVEKCVPSAAEAPYKATVYQALVKGDRFDTVIQKSVECGAVRIVPLITKRCTVKLEKSDYPKKRARWQKIAEEAAKQCGRGIVPTVEDPVTFTEMTDRLLKTDLPLFCYENGTYPIREALGKAKTLPESVAIVIGPEGGFEEEEAEAIDKSGAVPVSLGTRILRTESAAPFVLACLSFAFE